MLTEKDIKICEDLLGTFGVPRQMMNAVGTCADLAKAIATALRDWNEDVYFEHGKEDVIRGIVDVNIVIKQLRYIFEVTDEELAEREAETIKHLQSCIDAERKLGRWL